VPILDRLVGLETEYAIRFHPRAGAGEPPTRFHLYQALITCVKQRVLTAPARHFKEGVFLANGGAVWFETDLCQAILEGYLAEARHFLTGKDYDYIYDAVRLIAFELGLRFFTDYLEGNVYFKTKDAEHNLYRALVQFRLTESIEAQAGAIQAIVTAQRAAVSD